MKIIIDTNVVASAIFFGGRPRELLEKLLVPAVDHEHAAGSKKATDSCLRRWLPQFMIRVTSNEGGLEHGNV